MRKKIHFANNASKSTVEVARLDENRRNQSFRKYKRTGNSTRRAELIRVTCLKRADEEYLEYKRKYEA